MDEINKEADQWYIALDVESGCIYYFKGHGLDHEKIHRYLKEEYGEDGKFVFNETWGHYSFGEGRERWMTPSKKYKGVRGGFKITKVEIFPDEFPTSG